MPRGLEGHAKTNTLCEVHRKMYALLINESAWTPEMVGESRKVLLEQVKEVFVMAKKVSNKLKQYHCEYGSDWYQVHKLDGGNIEQNELAR